MTLLKLSVLVFLGVCVLHVSADKCFGDDSSHLSAKELFKEKFGNRKSEKHRNLHGHLKDYFEGRNSPILEVLDIIKAEAESEVFKDQWQSMFRTLWITGASHNDITMEKMCIMADMLSSGVERENGVAEPKEWSCIFDKYLYNLYDDFYHIVKWILSKQGCSTAAVPAVEKPSCFDMSKCDSIGKSYEFDEIWQQYNKYQEELQNMGKDKNDAPVLLAIARVLHNSDTLYDNYLGSILSASVMVTNWLWKAENMQSDSVYDAIKSGYIFEQAISNIDNCSCDELETGLLKRLQDYMNGINIVRSNIQSSLNKLESHGHVAQLKTLKKPAGLSRR